MKYFLIILFGLALIMGCSKKQTKENPSLVTKVITYSSDGTTLKGFLAYDNNKEGKRPGIIVVHEWWGQNKYARERAKMLANLGYIAFAIDMYGDGKTVDHPSDARKLAMAVMQKMDTATERFNAGLKLLKEQPQTDTSKIAAIGYCFGGGIVLRMALEGDNLDGVVSFHGDLPTEPAKNPEKVKANILVCNGEEDPFNSPQKVDEFENAMDAAKIKYKLISYPGAAHSFTNPASDSLGKKFNLPLAYNKEADINSWKEMQEFFNKIFNSK